MFHLIIAAAILWIISSVASSLNSRNLRNTGKSEGEIRAILI